MTRAAAPGFAEDIAARGFASGIAAAVSNDANFESVYAQDAGFVWRLLRFMGVADSQLEDAVQDVFVVVHRKLADFDGRSPVRTWLFAIAYRVASDYRRKRKRAQGYVPIAAEFRDPGPNPAESAERAQALQLLAELLDELDDDKRAVLVLAEVEGMTVPQIAAITGAGINTVYTRLRRARLHINKALAAREKGTP